jgi:hypothetical protein
VAKGQNTKKKKKKVKGLGVAGPPLKALGATPKRPKNQKKKKVWVLGGGRIIPKGLGGGSSTPQNPNFFFFFVFLDLLGVVGSPPRAWGGFDHPIRLIWGWPNP